MKSISGHAIPQNRAHLFCAAIAGATLILAVTSTLALDRQGDTSAKFSLAANAFSEGASVPTEYTCNGQDISPLLTWTEPPTGTRSFALIADDPDAPAGTWVHWVVYNLPASARRLPQAIPKSPELEGGGSQGANDFGKTGYNGPCPPPGKPHRYYFNLYALDAKVALPPGASKSALETAMKGHILAQARIMSHYGR